MHSEKNIFSRGTRQSIMHRLILMLINEIFFHEVVEFKKVYCNTILQTFFRKNRCTQKICSYI